MVFIKTIADCKEIKLSKFINEFKKYLDIDGRRYNASEKKTSIPKEHLEAVIKLTNEFLFEIVVPDEIVVDFNYCCKLNDYYLIKIKKTKNQKSKKKSKFS